MTYRLFAFMMAALLFASAAHADKLIALSFDDVPRHQGAFLGVDERAVKLIATLERAGVEQAVFFLNPDKLMQEQGKGGEDRIAAYVAAGHVIANHSNTHPSLNSVSAEVYLADIEAAELWLKGRPGYRPWFRYPYLHEGGQDKAKRDAVRAGLKARGLRNGYVTVDASDWNIDDMANAAARAGKKIYMTALRNFYVQRHVEAANFYDQLAIKTLGRSPVHVMLLHETDMAAMFIGELVNELRKDGWRIVTADQAFRDPIGKRTNFDTPSAQGTLTEMLAWQKGIPAPRWYEFNNGKKLVSKFRQEVLGEGVGK